jgi:hypothetical protein
LLIFYSLKLGLISADSLTVAGDGTYVHCHTDPFGVKVCSCREKNIFNCKCDCKFSDPDASYGWDSDLGTWFYGYTLYMLSTHNKDYCIVLPLHLCFLDARRLDSIGGIVSLHAF